MMRIAVAEISQETDTFNPISSVVTDFENSTLLYGEEFLHKKICTDVPDGARAFFSEKKDLDVEELDEALKMLEELRKKKND